MFNNSWCSFWSCFQQNHPFISGLLSQQRWKAVWNFLNGWAHSYTEANNLTPDVCPREMQSKTYIGACIALLFIKGRMRKQTNCLSTDGWMDRRLNRGALSSQLGLPRWLGGEESACNSGAPGAILGQEDSPGEGNDNSLQYSCLENPMNTGAWRATVHGVAESRT